MMNLTRMVAVILSAVAMSCENNPYPTDAIFEPVGQKVEGIRQEPLLFLYIPSIMRFIEGEEGVYKVDGTSPSGEMSIEAFNLPGEANFDTDTGELKWTPSFTDADNPLEPGVNYREYKVSFQLSDKEDTTYFLEKDVLMIVFDSTNDQEVEIEVSGNAKFKEGVLYNQHVKINNNKDSGTSSIAALYSNNLPSGATIHEESRGSRYRISFRPEADFVTVEDKKNIQGRWYKDINFDLQAVDLRGNVTTTVVKWRVFDVNEGIEVFYPKSMTVDKEVFFPVVAVDRNGESAPTLRVDDTGPYIVKKIFYNYITKDKWSYFSVFWKNIPPSLLGTTKTLNFKSCTNVYRSCQNFSVDVHFTERNDTE